MSFIITLSIGFVYPICWFMLKLSNHGGQFAFEDCKNYVFFILFFDND